MTPLAKPYNEDGSLNYYPAPQNTSGYNVLANYGKDNYTNEFIKNAAYLTGYINIRFSKYLNNRANISYNIIDRKNGYFFGENSYERKGTVPLAGKKISGRSRIYLQRYSLLRQKISESIILYWTGSLKRQAIQKRQEK